jgi:multidrug efflux system outer membrane protein
MAALDVTQARAAVFARQVDLLRAERLLLNAENALKRLIFTDITPYLQTRIITAEVPVPSADFDPAKNRLTALANRPEIRAAEARIRQSLINFNIAKKSLLPGVDITAGYQHRGRDDDFWTSLQDTTDDYETSWNIGLLLNIPLGFGAEIAARDIAALRLQQNQLSLAALQQDIILQVETSIGNVETARLANAAAREARIFSRQSLEAEMELLKNGSSTTFQVSQLQRDLSEARITELRTVLDWNRALAALAQAEGTILQRFGVKVVFDTPAKKSENKKQK